LFVLGVMLLAGWLWTLKGDSVDVLAVSDAVPAGATIERGDLRSVAVSGVADAIPVNEVDAAVGKTATVGLVPGQVLTRAALTSNPVPGSGQRMVGLLLDSTRAPAGLGPGNVVEVLEAPPSGDPNGSPRSLTSPQVLAAKAVVFSAATSSGGATRLSVLVPSTVANSVAEYGASGRVTVVQAPIGGDESTGGGTP
jgi:hypothetical protein